MWAYPSILRIVDYLEKLIDINKSVVETYCRQKLFEVSPRGLKNEVSQFIDHERGITLS